MLQNTTTTTNTKIQNETERNLLFIRFPEQRHCLVHSVDNQGEELRYDQERQLQQCCTYSKAELAAI